MDAVLLAGQEGFEIFEGLGIVHIHERIQARADVKHHVGGISEDDHPRGAKPESRMTPGRTQYQESCKYGQYEGNGGKSGRQNAQKGKYREPDDNGRLYGSGPIPEQVGEDQDEDSGHGEQALQMHAGAQKEQVDNEYEQAVAISVLGCAVPAQGKVERQDGE